MSAPKAPRGTIKECYKTAYTHARLYLNESSNLFTYWPARSLADHMLFLYPELQVVYQAAETSYFHSYTEHKDLESDLSIVLFLEREYQAGRVKRRKSSAAFWRLKYKRMIAVANILIDPRLSPFYAWANETYQTWLDKIKHNRHHPQALKDCIKDCLMLINGDCVTIRNNYLLSLIGYVFFKLKRSDEFMRYIIKAQSELYDPLGIMQLAYNASDDEDGTE